MDKFMSKLLHLILILLHIVYSLGEFLHKVWLYSKSWFCVSQITEDNHMLKTNVSLLKKLPVHIAINLGTEHPSYEDLAKIIVWCIASGITYITFYDYKGVIVKYEKELYNAVVKLRKGKVDDIKWNSRQSKNGTTSKHHVNCFGLSHGQQEIAKMTKQLAVSDDLTEGEVTTDLFDRYLYNHFKIPEPELAIVCGGVCCTYGFLPWHIRVTEFACLETHRKITVDMFYKILVQYSECEQKLGK